MDPSLKFEPKSDSDSETKSESEFEAESESEFIFDSNWDSIPLTF